MYSNSGNSPYGNQGNRYAASNPYVQNPVQQQQGDSSSSKVVRLLSQFLGVLSTLDGALYFLAHSNQGTLCLQA